MEQVYLGLKKKKDENLDKVGLFKQILETLMKKMKKVSKDFDTLYQEIYYGGSYFDGLALGSSDFDLNIVFKSNNFDIKIVNLGRKDPLTNFGHLVVTTPEQNMTKEEKSILETIDNRICISPEKVFAVLLNAVDKALFDELEKEIEYKGKTYQISRNVYNPVVIVVKEGKDFLFEIDLVPAFRLDQGNIPDSSETKENLLNFGEKFGIDIKTFLAIALRNVENVNGRFEIDFHDLEREILFDKECAKKVIRLMKYLRQKTGGQAKKLKSFLIKTVVMHKILIEPDEYWNNKNLDLCFIDCLTSLKDGLKKRFISDIFYPKLNLVDRLDDVIIDNNTKWLENLLEKYHRTGEVTAIFGTQTGSTEGIPNPKLPATLKTKMDEVFENFCGLITPSLQVCEEINETSVKLVHLLKQNQKSRYPIKKWKIVKGFDSRTFTSTSLGVDLLIHVNNNNTTASFFPIKDNIVNDWMDVLLLNTDIKEEDIRKTFSSLSFAFQGIPFNVLLAVEYDNTLADQHRRVLNFIREGNNPPVLNKYLAAELSEVRDDFINGQTEFTKDIIRLANYWNNSILLGTYTSARSLVIELLAIKTGIEELKKTAFPHHKKAFVRFLQKVQELQNQRIIFEENYKTSQIPPIFLSQVPLILDPANPYNNICQDIGKDFYEIFPKCAATTLRMIESGSVNMDTIFFPQPMLWRLLQLKRIPFHPNTYLVGHGFYSSQMPKSIIRINLSEQVKDLVQNMLNVLATHLQNIEAEKPTISEAEIQKEITELVNKMENTDHNWITRTDKPEDRAVTLVVPLIGENRGMFLSFNV